MPMNPLQNPGNPRGMRQPPQAAPGTPSTGKPPAPAPSKSAPQEAPGRKEAAPPSFPPQAIPKEDEFVPRNEAHPMSGHLLIPNIRRMDPKSIQWLVRNEDILAMLAKTRLIEPISIAWPDVAAGLSPRQRDILRANHPATQAQQGAQAEQTQQEAEWNWITSRLLPAPPAAQRQILHGAAKDLARQQKVPVPADLDAFVAMNKEAIRDHLKDMQAADRSPRAHYVPALSPMNRPALNYLKFIGTLPEEAPDPAALQRMWDAQGRENLQKAGSAPPSQNSPAYPSTAPAPHADRPATPHAGTTATARPAASTRPPESARTPAAPEAGSSGPARTPELTAEEKIQLEKANEMMERMNLENEALRAMERLNQKNEADPRTPGRR